MDNLGAIIALLQPQPQLYMHTLQFLQLQHAMCLLACRRQVFVTSVGNVLSDIE